MGKKVFITYKYGDTEVQKLDTNWLKTPIVRDYVNFLQDKFEESPHIFKAEEDDNDLSRFKNSTIESKLRDKIFDSTVTIILISKNMWDKNKPEDEQWIPWEVSYSLKEHSRDGRTSGSNALLAVVIPDKQGSYDYYMTNNLSCNSTTFHEEKLFRMLRLNMFNLKNKEGNVRYCNGMKIYEGHPSYIASVKWEDFIMFNNVSIDKYLNLAISINENIDNYNITKE